MHNRLEEYWCSCGYARTCQSNDIQYSTVHVEPDIHVDHICIVLVQLGNPDISQFGSLLVEYRSQGPELWQPKGWILWEMFERIVVGIIECLIIP